MTCRSAKSGSSTLKAFTLVIALGLFGACGGGTVGSQESVIAPSIDHLEQSSGSLENPTVDSSASGGTKASILSSMGYDKVTDVNSTSYDQDWQALLQTSMQQKKLPDQLVPPLAELDARGKALWNPCPIRSETSATKTQVCDLGNPKASRTALLLGDSKAMMLVPMMLTAVDLRQWRVLLLAQGNCPAADIKPWENLKWNDTCKEHREYTWAMADKIHPALTLISETDPPSGTEAAYGAGLARSLERLNRSSKLVVTVQNLPARGLDTCLGAGNDLTPCLEKGNREWKTAIMKVRTSAANGSKSKILDVRNWGCVGDTCPAVVGNMSVFTYGGHYTSVFAQSLSPMFAETLGRWGMNHLEFAAPEVVTKAFK